MQLYFSQSSLPPLLPTHHFILGCNFVERRFQFKISWHDQVALHFHLPYAFHVCMNSERWERWDDFLLWAAMNDLHNLVSPSAFMHPVVCVFMLHTNTFFYEPLCHACESRVLPMLPYVLEVTFVGGIAFFTFLYIRGNCVVIPCQLPAQSSALCSFLVAYLFIYVVCLLFVQAHERQSAVCLTVWWPEWNVTYGPISCILDCQHFCNVMPSSREAWGIKIVQFLLLLLYDKYHWSSYMTGFIKEIAYSVSAILCQLYEYMIFLWMSLCFVVLQPIFLEI